MRIYDNLMQPFLGLYLPLGVESGDLIAKPEDPVLKPVEPEEVTEEE